MLWLLILVSRYLAKRWFHLFLPLPPTDPGKLQKELLLDSLRGWQSKSHVPQPRPGTVDGSEIPNHLGMVVGNPCVNNGISTISTGEWICRISETSRVSEKCLTYPLSQLHLCSLHSLGDEFNDNELWRCVMFPPFLSVPHSKEGLAPHLIKHNTHRKPQCGLHDIIWWQNHYREVFRAARHFCPLSTLEALCSRSLRYGISACLVTLDQIGLQWSCYLLNICDI